MLKVKRWGYLLMSLLFFLQLSHVAAFEGDWTGPTIRWLNPTEGLCMQVTALKPSIKVVVKATDPAGVKQGIIWLKKGHHTTRGDITTWSRIWGETFASGSTAPDDVTRQFMLRMLGRGEGEFTLMAEFQDMARPNTSRSFVHYFMDKNFPTVSIENPTNNKTICKDFNLKVSIRAEDSGCGLKNVTLFIDRVSKATFIGADSTAPYEITVPSRRFTAKAHTLIVIATDKAGKSIRTSRVVKPLLICKVRYNR